MPVTGLTLYASDPDATPSPTEGRITLTANESLADELQFYLPAGVPLAGQTLALDATGFGFEWAQSGRLYSDGVAQSGSPLAAVLTESDFGTVVLADSTGTGTVTLPDLTVASAASLGGKWVLIRRTNAQIDITPAAGDSINGLAPGAALSLTAAGSSALVFALSTDTWAAFVTP